MQSYCKISWIVVAGACTLFVAAAKGQAVPPPPAPIEAAGAAGTPGVVSGTPARPPASPAVASARGGPQQAENAGADPQARGPIHEGFAEPVNTGAVAPLTVSTQPPEPINEIPSDARPAGADTIWLGGYWSWDDDRNDFLWVSGTWRTPPPGHRWIPGYWAQGAQGFEWVPGMWTPSESEEIAYYPQPPEAKEEEPQGQAPSPDAFWIPGYWQWAERNYAWQPGFWSAAQADWVWQSPSYHWSPRGWAFREGFWDYPLARRGLLFAPVAISRTVYGRPGYVYSPSVVIDPTLVTFSLFVRPNYCHYYFGDYYAAKYDRLSIYPWFSVSQRGRFAYDPLFSYYGWYNRGRDPRWADNLRGWHTYYRNHADQRPPHDFASLERTLATAEGRRDRAFLAVARPLTDWRGNASAPVRLTSVSPSERNQWAEAIHNSRQFSSQRARLEAAATGGAIATRPGQPQTPQTARSSAPGGPQKLRVPSLPDIGRPQGATPRIATRPDVNRPVNPGPARGPETKSGPVQREVFQPAIPDSQPRRMDTPPKRPPQSLSPSITPRPEAKSSPPASRPPANLPPQRRPDRDDGGKKGGRG